MDVEQGGGARSQRGDQVRAKEQLGDVVTVENVHVEPVGYLTQPVDRVTEGQQVS